MNYQQFIEEVERRVKEKIKGNETITVYIHTAVKNNGKERKGITVSEKGIHISPTIYLEEYFQQFQEGKPIEKIVEKILQLYEEVKCSHPCEESLLQNYEELKGKFACKLIHRGKNEKLLNDIPYVPWMDLAIVAFVLLEVSPYGTATVLVRKEHLEIWGLTEAQLFDEAKKNTPILLPYQFCPMRKLLREICPYAVDEGEEEEESLYVLSNKLRSFGAASMLYEGILEKVGQKLGENYYILPSSIHEVIVVPESKSPVKQDLEEMVREINETQVEEEEVLSDRVYYFSRKENRLFL
ncbi:DUF5688 family protein [Faecalimonas umbilicata]|uniref:DUF5688 family protein n=1 Tax=Faecalimonas umbilicata TaxID=1912855 RepID=UPI002A7FC1A1|nr:DUF5688 family protein [Faecalimonas umbilicata]MDY4597291.1 DUF5688 family protein [Faecalimonas umbilicata]